MSKLLIHFDFVSVLNNNGIQSIESANQEIEDLKNEFKELWGEYKKTIEKHDSIFKMSAEENKNRRK